MNQYEAECWKSEAGRLKAQLATVTRERDEEREGKESAQAQAHRWRFGCECHCKERGLDIRAIHKPYKFEWEPK